MDKKTLLAASISLALASGSSMAALENTSVVGIDWDGTGTAFDFTEVGVLDWGVNSSWTDGSVTAGTEYTDALGNTYSSQEAILLTQATGATLTCTANCGFDLYTHATLSAYKDENLADKSIVGVDGGGNLVVINEDFEWTFITHLSEDVGTISTSFTDTNETVGGDSILVATSTRTFVMSDTGNTTDEGFFFEIYYDDTPDADGLSGTGYDDGQLIMSASELLETAGNISTDSFAFVDANGSGGFDLGEQILTGDIAVDGGGTYSFVTWANMDSALANDWNDGTLVNPGNPECDGTANATDGGNCLTATAGVGATDLEALVDQTTLDSDFFDPANFPLAFINELVFTTQNVLPFVTANPSQCYDTVAGGATDNCSGYVFGSIVNPNGTISGDVVNGSSSTANCFYAFGAPGSEAELGACLQNTTIGDDVLFQTDANQGFRTAENRVPEPGTMALLGLGLGFLGLSRRRRQRA